MTRTHAAADLGLPKIHAHWSQPPAPPPAADCNLAALGDRFEPLLRDYIDVHLQWVSRSRQARAAIKRLNLPDWMSLSDEDRQEQHKIHRQIFQDTGSEAASTRMTTLYDELEPLADLIRDEKDSTLAGLRARALVVLFEAMPGSANEDKLQFEEQGAQEAASSLLLAAAELTGLGPLVRDTEHRLAALGPYEDEQDEGEGDEPESEPEEAAPSEGASVLTREDADNA